MPYRNMTTAQLQDIDAAHHLHPFTDQDDLRAVGSRMITSAKGAYITDSDGNEILDGMAGLWCVNAGYGWDELAEVAAEQMRELPYYNSFFRATTPPAVLLAQKMASLAPENVNQVFFGSSGSESNDTALRIVRHYWAGEGKPEKNIIISRHTAYHGSTIAGTSLGGMSAMHGQLYGAVPGIRHVMPPYAFEHAEPGESDEAFGLRAAAAIEDAILEAGPDKVAAFIGEPVMGAGGVKIAPDSYWPEVQRICRKYDVLLMIDEVITGFGRTGNWFACQTYDIVPDTITVAKGLTSGYAPLSAVMVGDRVAKSIASKGEFFHGYTYSGHPVACAVGLRNLEIIEREGMVDKVREDTGPYFNAQLKARLGSHPMVGEARSIGLMGAIELVKPGSGKERFPEEVGIGNRVRDAAIANGLMIRAVGNTIIQSPPLLWTRKEVDLACDRLSAALDTALASV